MDVDYDPAKSLANIAKHGVPLWFGSLVLDAPMAIVVGSARTEDREDREKAIGLVDGRLWTAIFVRRGEVTRFIRIGEATMPSSEPIIAIPADPDDPDDFDVTEAELQRALAERRTRKAGQGETGVLLDADVLAKFRATGPGWQTRINEALRAAEV